MRDTVKIWELKVWPQYFQAIKDGDKRFDVRKGNDRDYQVNDELVLREWNPAESKYTGRQRVEVVSYVMHGAPFLPDDLWVLGFASY